MWCFDTRAHCRIFQSGYLFLPPQTSIMFMVRTLKVLSSSFLRHGAHVLSGVTVSCHSTPQLLAPTYSVTLTSDPASHRLAFDSENLFQIAHMSEITWRLSFCLQHISFRTGAHSSMPVVRNDRISFFLGLGCCLLYKLHFLHSSFEGHLGCCHFSALGGAAQTQAHRCLFNIQISCALGIHTRVGFLNHMLALVLIFLRNFHAVYSNATVNSVPTSSEAGFPFPSSFSHEVCDTQHVFITVLCFFFLFEKCLLKTYPLKNQLNYFCNRAFQVPYGSLIYQLKFVKRKPHLLIVQAVSRPCCSLPSVKQLFSLADSCCCAASTFHALRGLVQDPSRGPVLEHFSHFLLTVS